MKLVDVSDVPEIEFKHISLFIGQIVETEHGF